MQIPHRVEGNWVAARHTSGPVYADVQVYYVYGPDGQHYGPADTATLRQWCSQGRILRTTILVDAYTQTQVQAQNLPELADLLAAIPPPIAPPTVTALPPNVPPGTPIVQVHNYVQVPSSNPLASSLGRRNRWVAAALAFFAGAFGVHRFYLGDTNTGVAMALITVLTCGYGGIITGIWALVDLVRILTGSMNDANGIPLEG